MAQLGHSFVSANKGTQWGLNADQGAGANAGSVDEMVFMVHSSLSELVWSPRKGLRVKCADYSVVDKSSPLWCSESGNMIIQPSRSIVKGEEIENDGIVNEENLCSVQLTPNQENAIYITETLVRSPRGCVGIMPQIGCQEASSRSCGIKDPMITALPIAEVDSNRVDKSAKEEMDMCSLSVTQEDADINKNKTLSIATLHENASTQDQDNMKSANSSSNMLEETRPDLVPVEPEIVDLTTGVSSDEKGGGVGGGNNQAAGSADTLVSKASQMKLNDIPKRSMSIQSQDVKHAEPVSVFEGNSGNKIFNLEKQESMAENNIKPLKTGDKLCCGSPRAQVGTTVALQPEVAGHCPENKAMVIEASSNERGSSLKRRKGKEKAFSSKELNVIISMEEDGSHESVESSNSGQLFSKGKRAGKFDHQLAAENKRIKRHQSETPCSASFIGQDSSFMNWISNMMKGLSKFDSDVTPLLALPAEPSHWQHESHDTLVESHDKSQDPVSRSTGFLNVFQALYCPTERLQNKVKCSLDRQTEAEGSKELQLANKMLCDNSSYHAASNEENPKLHKHAHVGTSTLPSVCSVRVSSAEEKPINLFDIASDSKSGEYSSDSYFKRNSDSREEKEALIHGSIPNTFSNSVANRSPLESLWITRFSPKVSTQTTPMLNSVECHQDKGETTEGFTGCNRLHPLHHNLILPIKDKYNLEDGREPPIKDQINAVSTVQYCPVSPTGSCGSIRTVQADQKFKPKLNPFLPSQRFKSSEAMASVFARRLDALKHISPLKVTVDVSPAAVLCFYCGKTGHLLRDCSEIIESEFKDLLKGGNMCYGFEEASCLCIRCFQFNHWAVACPYSSTRKQTCQNDNASCLGGVNSERNQDKPQNQNLLVDTCTVTLRENSRDNTKFMACTNKINGTMILNGRYSDNRTVKSGLLEQNCHTGMSSGGASHELILNKGNAALSSQVNELNENQIMPYCNKQISSMPREAFEIIRRLRLSRSDILKWMKSPHSNFCLEGFFLRLRLGKWEEGVGGTGYHVACISGASRESSSGKSKFPISVDIGGLKCAVDCCYVSNHEFNEDELKAWWCANLKGPRKLPIIEELNMKLVEKEKYGF